MTLFLWSQTAADNATADTTINWREGQSPSSINDSARAMMAAIAKYRDDMSGSLVTTGISTAYELSSNQGLSNLTDKFSIAFTVHVTNGTPATLSVDSLADKPLRYAPGLEMPAGLLTLNAIYTATYSSDTEEWLLKDVAAPSAFIARFPTGVSADFHGATAPAGWVLLSGRTIGDGSSAATERANADCADLFTFLWTEYSNTVCPVSSGRGGSAAADFASHKTITLLDMRGRSTVGKDDMGGSAASRVTSAGSGVAGATLGAVGGLETNTLTVNQLPVHDHTITDKTHVHSFAAIQSGGSGVPSGGAVVGSAGRNTDPAFTGITGTNTTGSGDAHNNMGPVLVANRIIKL